MNLDTLISLIPLLDITNYTAYATSKSVCNKCVLLLNQWPAACNIRMCNLAIFRMISHFKSMTVALPCDVRHTSSSAVHLQMKQHGALTPMRKEDEEFVKGHPFTFNLCPECSGNAVPI